MRAAIFILLVCSSAVFSSCEKETSGESGSGFIKSLECEYDVVTVGSVMLQDNSVITVARVIDGSVPGFMYKLDEDGNVLWEKRLNDKNKGSYQVYDTKGNGFVVLGYDDLNDTFFQVFMYDDEGNFLYSKSIPFDLFWYSVRYFSAIQMLELSNGNFVFACNQGDLVLYFTNSSFEPLFRRDIATGYTGSYVQGIYQTSDSTLLFANAWSLLTPPFSTWQYDVRMIQTDLNGDSDTSTYIIDTLLNETPNVLLPMGDKMFLVTGMMGMFNQSAGALVNYQGNGFTVQISGAINLVHTEKDGSYISRQTIQDYPANGMIMNGRTTMDGGYILCGTVNQSDVTNIISPTKIYIMKVNSSGRFEWSRMFETPYPSFGIDAIQTRDGGYFISGYERALDKRFNPIVIKTDSDGNI